MKKNCLPDAAVAAAAALGSAGRFVAGLVEDAEVG